MKTIKQSTIEVSFDMGYAKCREDVLKLIDETVFNDLEREELKQKIKGEK